MNTTSALQPINYVAGGTIEPCRFVIHSTATKTVTQAAAVTSPYAGISQEGSAAPPISGAATAAATSGTGLRVYGPGEECTLEIGSGGVTAGDMLVSDSSGKGITRSAYNSANVQFVGAIALATASAGELCPVRVVLFNY